VEGARSGGETLRRAARQALVLGVLAVVAFASAFAIARAVRDRERSAADPEAQPQPIDRMPIRPAVPNLDLAGPMPKLGPGQGAGAAGGAP
jgi:hypothetical protein